MSSDNPIGNIFAKFLNKGTKSVSDYLLGIVGQSTITDGPLAKMHTFDKYGVLANIDNYSVSFREEVVQNLGKKLSSNKFLYLGNPNKVGPGTDLGELFSNITRKFKLGFAYNKSADQLFMLSEAGTQIALPLQKNLFGIDSGIVNIGGIRRGAYRALSYATGTEASYSELFYKALSDITKNSGNAETFLRKVGRINNLKIGMGASGKQATLGGLLTSSAGIRGTSVLGIESKMFATRARLVNLPSEVLDNFNKFRQARYVINAVTKSAGTFVPTSMGRSHITWLTGKESAPDALRKAWGTLDEFMEQTMPGLLSRLGVSGFHHIVKPEGLIGDKGLIVPSKLGLSMYEAYRDARQGGKGTFGRYHESVLTPSQRKLISSTGGEILPTHILEGELKGRGVNNLTRRAVRVAVVKDATLAAELGLAGDSGALLTSLGKKRFSSREFYGSFNINNPSERTLEALRLLTGKNVAMGEELSNIAMDVSRRDLGIAIEAAHTFDSRGLSEKQRALVSIIRRSKKGSGIFDYMYDKGVPFSLSTRVSSNGIKLSFNSVNLTESNIVEGLFEGGVRFTGAGVAGSHPLSGALEELSKHGIEIVIPESFANKVEQNTRYVSNFLSYMKNAGRGQEAIDAIGGSSSFDKHGNMKITFIRNSEEARKAAEKVVAELKLSKFKSDRRLARNITKGSIVARAGTAFREFSSKAVRMMFMNVSRRSDTGLDINPLKSHRFTPGKMKTLAWNSKLMGYPDPNSDPIFSMLASRWKGLRMNATGMDFEFLPENNIYQYVKNLRGGFTPKAEDIVTFSGGETFLGGKKIKSLPGLKNFSMSSGGVSRELLEGTLFDNSLRQRLLYIDLGTDNKLAKFLPGESRYLPLPMMMSRVGQTSGRYVIGKNHNFFGYTRLLDRLRTGNTSGLRGSLHKAVRDTLVAMVGKKGILENMHTIHTPASVAIRLSPPIYHTSNMFNIDEMYDMTISRKSFSKEMMRKMGLSKSEMSKMLEIAQKKDFTYVMMGADPAQRGEHLGSIFRLKFTDETISGSDNVLAPQMHEFVKKLFERDTDRDRMNMILLEAMDNGKISPAQYEERIARQKKLLSPSVAFLKSTFLKLKDKSGKSLALKDLFNTYLGQKINAALGYTITRPSDRITSLVMTEGAEGLTKLGIRLDNSTEQALNNFKAMFVGDIEKQGSAMALNQFLYQAGVKKGSEGKNTLRELTIALTQVSKEAKEAGFVSLERIQARLQRPLEALIRDADMQRFWQAAPTALMESEKGKAALARLQQGLEIGAKEQEILIKNAAKIMSMNLGLGAAIRPFVGNLSSVGELFQGSSPSRISEYSFIKRIADPILKIVSPKMSTGLAESVTPAKAKGMSTISAITQSKSNFYEKIVELSKSKAVAPIALGLAGLTAYNYMNRPDVDSPLPPPVDTSMPADYGPSVPDYSNVAYINTSPNIPRASKIVPRTNFRGVNSNYFSSSTSSRVTIEDKTSPYSPWLMRQQMNKIANSDFTY